MKMQHLGGLVNIAIVNFRNLSQAQCGWLIDIFLVLDIFLPVMLVCMCVYVLHVSVCVYACVLHVHVCQTFFHPIMQWMFDTRRC